MLSLPIQPAPSQFGALFDADTKAAIASGLCIRCRGAKLLCGKTRCPILVRWDSMMKTAPMIDRMDLDGSSPPGVFVGRFGYPRVYVGPLVPPVHGDTQILDAPEAWVGRPMEDIVYFRSQLVRGMHRVHVHDVDRGGRIVDLTRELALGSSPAEVEAGFARKPHGRIVLDDNVQPFGPSAPLHRLEIGTVKVDPNLERASCDTDLYAKEAVLDLYGRGAPVSRIQRAFSVGAFGLEKNRRFVPTRWSITAVDDTIGKELHERVKAFPLLNEIRVHEAIGFDDRFLVVMIPRPWRYELIEAWYPNTLWNPLGREVVMFGDHEGSEGRTTYASIGGCYYAARLAVGEALNRNRRQAATVILRETHPGYIMPVGVWNVREHVREALRRPPRTFATMGETLAYLRTRLDIPMERYVRISEVLSHVLHQRTFDDFDFLAARGRRVDGPGPPPCLTVPSSNEFPDRPVPAVGAIVFRDGEVLLVKRGTEPNKGRWSLPGGVLEVGETVEAGAVRETLEETGVTVRPERVFSVLDFIAVEGEQVHWHYVLIDLLCEYVHGKPFPATDAENARFTPIRELGDYDVVPAALEVVQRASSEREGSAAIKH